MLGLLTFLGRHATTAMAVGVFVALAVPTLAELIRPLLIPTIIGMMVLSILRLDPQDILLSLKSPKMMLPALAFMLLVCPFIGVAAAKGLDLSPGIAIALVVWCASPPLVSVTAIANIVGLDGALTLVLMALGGLIMPLTLPPIVLGLLELQIDIPVLELMGRLVAILVGTVILSRILRAAIGAERLARNTETIDGLFVILMVLFAFGVMDGVTDLALEDPKRLLFLLAIVFGSSLLLQLLGFLIFLWLGRRAAATIGLTVGSRNMAIVLSAAPAAFPQDVFIYLALLQFPIYLLPALLRPIYRRISAAD